MARHNYSDYVIVDWSKTKPNLNPKKMAKTKLPQKPKGKMTIDKDILFTKKFLEAANKIAVQKATINGVTTEREKLAAIRKTARENSKVGKKTNALSTKKK